MTEMPYFTKNLQGGVINFNVYSNENIDTPSKNSKRLYSLNVKILKQKMEIFRWQALIVDTN